MFIAGSLIQNLVPRNPGSQREPFGHEPERGGDYYFVGYPSYLFRVFAPRIFAALGERVAGVITDTFVTDYSHMTLWGTQCALISMQDFQVRAKIRPLKVVHFFEQCEQFWWHAGVDPSDGVEVLDFLSMLDQLNLAHTYVPVSKERDWWSEQSEETIAGVAAHFGDERSRRTLFARLAALSDGNRRPLIDVAVLGAHEYFNSTSPHWSLVPRGNDTYVDVGAAHGDTVAQFIAAAKGNFARIEAFEPTAAQFGALSQVAAGDDRVRVHQVAVGDTAGMIPFHEDATNPFGSNAITVGYQASRREVPCVRLDDVIDHCTLVKMDVEGFECNVLRGAKRLVSTARPDMAITCYHYPQDLIDILNTVQELHDYEHVALRHFGPTLYDSVLFFSDHQSFA